jgi:hypothetical protein
VSAHRSYKVELAKPTTGVRRQYVKRFKRFDNAKAFARLQALQAGEEFWLLHTVDNGILGPDIEVWVNP